MLIMHHIRISADLSTVEFCLRLMLVRIEEMINYFKYDYPEPEGEHPFSVYTELAGCPWNTRHQLLLVGLQGKKYR